MEELRGREDIVLEFDEEQWMGTVEKVTVMADGKMSFEFKDGREY